VSFVPRFGSRLSFLPENERRGNLLRRSRNFQNRFAAWRCLRFYDYAFEFFRLEDYFATAKNTFPMRWMAIVAMCGAIVTAAAVHFC
jgi:hypothetical protein